ncbi:OpcA protein, partial [Leucobacter sp. M11]|nr:OpcA protein [Leucobacter sp. M11]
MILQLSDTTVSEISKHLVQIRVESGVSSLGRVLTLIIVTTPDALEE